MCWQLRAPAVYLPDPSEAERRPLFLNIFWRIGKRSGQYYIAQVILDIAFDVEPGLLQSLKLHAELPPTYQLQRQKSEGRPCNTTGGLVSSRRSQRSIALHRSCRYPPVYPARGQRPRPRRARPGPGLGPQDAPLEPTHDVPSSTDYPSCCCCGTVILFLNYKSAS